MLEIISGLVVLNVVWHVVTGVAAAVCIGIGAIVKKIAKKAEEDSTVHFVVLAVFWTALGSQMNGLRLYVQGTFFAKPVLANMLVLGLTCFYAGSYLKSAMTDWEQTREKEMQDKLLVLNMFVTGTILIGEALLVAIKMIGVDTGDVTLAVTVIGFVITIFSLPTTVQTIFENKKEKDKK